MNLFGHKYIGPGNKLRNGVPIDEDDVISLLHDLEYELAIKKEDIIKADEKAISQFLQDFVSTGNYHSLIGYSGLKIKNVIENFIGVQYPRMPKQKLKNLNRGNYRYAAAQSAVWERYRELKKANPKLTAQEYRRNPKYQYKLKLQEYQRAFDVNYPRGSKFDSNDGGTENSERAIVAESNDNFNFDTLSDFGDFEQDQDLNTLLDDAPEVVLESSDIDKLFGDRGRADTISI